MISPPAFLIDGAAGTGKTTLARRLSAAYALGYFDSGLLYRTATWRNLDGEMEASQLLSDVLARPGREPILNQAVRVRQRWLTDEPWSTPVTRHVAEVASWPQVRAAVNALCTRLVEAEPLALTGRDVGRLLVVRQACRIELRCSEEVRIERLSGRGELDGQRHRLELELLSHYVSNDGGAIQIDTSLMTPDDVLSVVKRALWESPCR